MGSGMRHEPVFSIPSVAKLKMFESRMPIVMESWYEQTMALERALEKPRLST